ncbi:hypothetical protein BUALT_Bualt08G0051300 [Buddleja alternifolia]|uniref:Thioredoxin domain-containing protein n=1 Tax=Buddleja alternifolia TaxID=168488 RepID=A0AAV6XBU6_9LAMI|nr:hypothetical protein BUALT_Bualt08G0051300 [Buddleja alternifolia]
MTVTLLIQYGALEYFIHDVETVGLTLEGVFDRIFFWTNVDAHLFVGKIPKLQGVIPLYADVIDILNDDDLKMVLNIYTDMGNKVVELKFKMEMPDSIQPETSNIVRLGVKEIENVAHHGIQKPNGSHTTLEIPIVAQPGVEEEVQQEFHVNENDSMLSSEIEKEVPCNETEDDSAEDSEDDLSDYKSSDGEKFQGLSDVDEAHTNGMRMLSDEIVGNYFHQSEGNIDELEVGMTFDDVDHFRMVVKNFSIQEDFPLERVKNERSRVTLKCQREGCTWRIHASPVGADKKTYQIKSYNANHTCDPFGDGCKEASATWIANKMKDDFESNPLTDVNTLGMNLKKRHGVSVSSWKLYRARQKAMDLVSGDHKESYAKIPNYIAALRKIDVNIFIGLKCDGLDISNPLSHCRFERQADPLHYVHPYFTRSAYLKTYEGKIPTMQDKIHWPSVEHPLILPPLKMRGKDQKGKTKQNNKGRPFVNRRREADEPAKKAKRSTVIHCRKCKKINHNWRTCPQRPENQEKNKKKRKKASGLLEHRFSQKMTVESFCSFCIMLKQGIFHHKALFNFARKINGHKDSGNPTLLGNLFLDRNIINPWPLKATIQCRIASSIVTKKKTSLLKVSKIKSKLDEKAEGLSDDDGLCPVDCVREFQTDEEFLGILKKAKESNALVVVDFYRTSCGSCKYIEQGFAKLCKGSGNQDAPVVFLKHNVIDEYDEQSEVADRLRIKTVPLFHFYKNGVLLEAFPTRDKERILEAIRKYTASASQEVESVS